MGLYAGVIFGQSASTEDVLAEGFRRQKRTSPRTKMAFLINASSIHTLK